MGIVSKLKQIPRILYVVLAIFLATWSLSVPILMTQEANAAASCTIATTTNDAQGANDEPGQKDLSLYCLPTGDAAGFKTVVWQWDEIAWSGSNTGDACALFDTDGDNKANTAVCVTVSGSPASQTGASPRIYTCDDSYLYKCGNSSLVNGPYITDCDVTQSATDPFSGPANKKKGAAYPNDTRAECVVKLSEVGANAVLKDVCSYPSQQPNSDPSDCVVTPTGNPDTVIEVKKDISPNDDNGRFDLKIDLETDVIATNQGDGGTTGEVKITDKKVTISESGYSPTSLSNYTTKLVCVDDEDLTATPFVNNVTVTGTTTRSYEVTLPNGVIDATCTFVNTRIMGSVKVVKDVVNDNGGGKTSADFTFTNNSGAPQGFDVTASPDGQKILSLPVGSSFSIQEVEANTGGYSTSYTGTCSGTVTTTQQTCTIINNDQQGTLIVNKIVNNNNGGTAQASAFSFTKTGTGGTSYNFVNDPNNTQAGSRSFTVNAGSYSVTENTYGGYTMTGNTCNNITVPNGGSASCTITNDDDAPKLTLIKALGATYGSGNVIGDWNLTATGTAQSPTNLSGATGTAGATSGADFKADTYTLGETGPSGYTSSWDCVGGNSVVNATIAISLGQNVTCTVTNSGIQPKITLYKVIDGDQYGDNASENDFGLTIGGEAATSGTTYGKNVGSYSIDEEGLYGYEFVEITGDEECPTKLGDTVTLELGDDITCTIHNRAIQPKLIVKKHVINGNNGTSTAGSFTMTVSGTNVSDNEFPGDENGTEIYLDEGEYSVDELENSAYAKSIGADCSGSIAVGEVKTCTITNDDIQPKITLVKVIENDEQYGDDAVANDFGLTIDGNTVDSGVAYGKDAGYYQISENGLEGYQFVNISGHERCPETLGGSVQLFVGDDITCTIQNRAIQPKLMIKKTVVNDNSGTKEASDFTITVDGTNVSDNEFPGTSVYTTIYLDEGTYSVDEIADEGYIKTLSKDCSGTIALGETKYCTVTNDDVTNPAIEVIKYGPETAYEGDVVTYWFKVTNTGDTTLYNVSVSDDIADNEVCDKTTLAKGEFTWCSATYTIPSQQKADVTNTVTACGYEYANEIQSVDDIVIDQIPQQPVCNTDTHTLDVLHPSIAVVKSGPSTANAGEKVTYTFTVTNTGDIALSSLTVEDDIAGSGTYVSGDINDDLILEPGETWVYNANYNIPSDQTKNVVNTVTVCGYEWFKQDGEEYALSRQTLDSSDAINNPEETPVCATDSHTLTVPQVLGATTTAAPKPTVLANTGSGINVTQLIAPLFLIGATLSLAIASRRTNKTSTK